MHPYSDNVRQCSRIKILHPAHTYMCNTHYFSNNNFASM